MKHQLLLLLTFLFSLPLLHAQNPNKKILDHSDLTSWNKIQNRQISNDGNWVAYSLKPEEGDASLHIWNAKTGKTQKFDRGEQAKISADNQFIVFKISPALDSVKAQRRKKVKKDDLPKDTLGILNLATQELTKIPNVQSFKLPEKWSGWVAYQKGIEKPEKKEKQEPDSTQVVEPDTTLIKPDSSLVESTEKTPKKKKKKPKKEGKKTGTKLVLHELATGEEQVIEFVKSYTLAKEGARIVCQSTGKDSSFLAGIYLFDCAQKNLQPLFRSKGEYKSLTFDKLGKQVAFHANLDTTEALVPPFGLCYWKEGQDSARVIADSVSQFLPKDWRISENGRLLFSEDGSKLFFGIAPQPILQDTAILDDEIVNVEVWHWQDPMLHTQQKNLLAIEKKRTYQAVWHTNKNRFVQLGTEEARSVFRGDEENAPIALGFNQLPYWKESSWEGFPQRRDLYIIDVNTGTNKQFGTAIRGSARLSPKAKFAIWYSSPDSAWFSYSIANDKIIQLTNNQEHPFFNELNDAPRHPSPYGIAGWTKEDQHLLIYDRYDIWKIDPQGQEKPLNLTQGRASNTRYRYIRLDPEERFIEPNARLMLHVFNEKTKESGYGFLRLNAGKPVTIVMENKNYTRSPLKAKNADKLIFTKEDFQTFPNLLYTDFSFQDSKQVSDANPQQNDYSWGKVEMYEWTSLDGQTLQGLLVKPDNFDPTKKYPMIVNFYERSTDGLYRHRAPFPHRSTINYSFYVSRGYVIFNPDVPYRTGYPGESAYNSVISGVTALINEGFVDKERIGVQGHSWGGYQIAHLITKTDIFKCAESGAPVVNMFSAYGGIRWGSGLSRMFQYEHSQSRIGGTIWEYPLRYLENSPLFFLDKVNTPVLILHNDKDGAVPWYQGIEYFVGLRRLGKPAWLLNYNEEPHWPVKLQNRKDFNIRMQQFFDYYLKDAAIPRWMERGVPAIEKGILQGLELKDEK